MLGMLWVSVVSPIGFLPASGVVQLYPTIDELTLYQVFAEAVPKFANQHGGEISPVALQNGYRNGTVTVEYLGEGSTG